MAEPIKKLYYSISEVSELTGIKQYVLRYWESEFNILAPNKNRSGNRIYTEDDISKVLLIKKLLYEEKFTVDGAKVRLKEMNSESGNNFDSQISLIHDIKNDLKNLLSEIN